MLPILLCCAGVGHDRVRRCICTQRVCDADRMSGRLLDDLALRGETRVGELFGFDRLAGDWSVRFDDGLPEQLIYLLVAGAIQGRVRGRSVSLHPGSLLWLPAR